MAHHEHKSCPRCGAPFECKVGSILQCQCSGLIFTGEEKEYIALNYRDCLCRACLLQIKHEHNTRNVGGFTKNIFPVQMKSEIS
ncbi:MAG: cysteine-rich CWC family protein [Bacteroidota bacterium]